MSHRRSSMPTTTPWYSSLPEKKFNTLKRISRRLLKMLKGDTGATCKSPAKLETDAETKAITCLADILDKQKLFDADRRMTDAVSTSSDGECHRGERFVIYVEVERHRGLATVIVDKAVPAYTWTEEIIRDHLERDIPEMTQMVILSPTACMFFKG